MKIEALRFVLQGSDYVKTKSWLEADRQKLAALKEDKTPSAYVIDREDMAKFTSVDTVENLGSKSTRHTTVDLGRLMIGRKGKIPLIDGDYRTAARALNGIHKLLLRGERSSEAKPKDENIYLIGVTKDVFAGMSLSTVPSKPKHAKDDGPEEQTQPDLNPTTELIWLLCDVRVRPELEERYVGTSPEVQLVRKLIVRAGEFKHPVLILGDTGTGKEIVARSIHELSGRPKDKFFPVNCGAIPEYLFEAELFGHVKGAFTHAVSNKTGLWEMAKGGTLFLDELGELASHHQAKILRTLQEGTIRRVGGTNEVSVKDARVLAATNKDLYSLVNTGQFREDLYYRLRGFLIRTPALREHREDIPLIARHFWARITGGTRRPLPGEIITELTEAYSWPGNVRELKMVLSHLHTLFDESNLGVRHLRAVFAQQGQVMQGRAASRTPGEIEWKKVEFAAHLNRVYEVMKAVEMTVKPLSAWRGRDESGLSAIQSDLQHRLDELDALCAYPLRFGTESLFYTVSGSRTKLAFLIGLLRESSPSGLQESKKHLISDFASTLTAIEKEVKDLLGSS